MDSVAEDITLPPSVKPTGAIMYRTNTISVLNECDVTGAVWIVLDPNYGAFDAITVTTLEVDWRYMRFAPPPRPRTVILP